MTIAGARLDQLNIVLMAASCAAAFLIPFELFLLAYAVLGPLHYLTEISWLHDRRYFVARSDEPVRRVRLWLALIALTLAAMIFGLVRERLMASPVTPVFEIALFYLTFVAAALLAFRVDQIAATALVFLTGVGLLVFASSPGAGLLAFLLITIIHVLVFTAAFVLLGALKSRSCWGLASVAVYAACVASFFVIWPAASPASAFIRHSYQPFEALNSQLIRTLGLGPGSALRDIYESPAGGAVMRLIAFAYTYHYLNWFTKTPVIGWNKVSPKRAGAIAALWLAAMAVYAYDYLLGFVVLYSLSVLHVMLELPLNHLTFAGIGRELRMLLVPRRPALEPAPATRQVSRKAARKAARARGR
jgi:hypothetical protein